MKLVTDVAHIILAAVSLYLAYYIFVYQKNKDKENRAEAAQKEQEGKIAALNLQEQNIRLQWFKELIIQPHLADINHFYSQLHSIESRFEATMLEAQKIEVINFIKAEQSKLRKSFYDVLLGVNPQLYNAVKDNLDKLIDGMTNTIFNDGLNLNHKPTFDKEIGSQITYSRNDLIKNIYNYKGN